MKKIDIEVARHSLAHVMAQAMHRLHKNVNQGVGPAIENGFYQDFVLPKSFKGAEELPQLKKEIQKLIKENLEFVKKQVSKKEALKIFSYDKYKSEMINELPGDKVTVYTCGEYRDLCKGPHLEKTGQLKQFAWQLERIAGAYWKGDEKNIMMTRIYGLAFDSKEELKKFQALQIELAKRDHRKLGKELDLFSISEKIGPGLILWHPKLSVVREEIELYWRKEHRKRGYEYIYTPHVGKASLWETSGHLSFFKDGMFPPMKFDKGKEDYYVKPMSCPFHVDIYKTSIKSYRDLPLRWCELGTVYRYEEEGVLHGMLRVRGLTQDDAHIVCRDDQFEEEFLKVLDFAVDMNKTFGFDDLVFEFSVRDPENKEGFIGSDKTWEFAEKSIKKMLDSRKIKYKVGIGEAKFYGPALDLKAVDAFGREWQGTTIQLDFNLPEKFNMTYVDKDGKEKQPVMIHRTLLGAMERFVGTLIEQTGGAFPLWLAPVQVQVIPVGEGHHKFAEKLQEEFLAEDVRAKVDNHDETVGNKIRKAAKNKIPYILVVGDKEAKGSNLSIKERGKEEVYSLDKKKFIDLVLKQIKDKK